MSADKLRHRPNASGHCIACEQPWPCPQAVLSPELEAQIEDNRAHPERLIRHVNEALPGQLTVKELREALADQQDYALVAFVEPWESGPNSFTVYKPLKVVKAEGGPVVLLGAWKENDER